MASSIPSPSTIHRDFSVTSVVFDFTAVRVDSDQIFDVIGY